MPFDRPVAKTFTRFTNVKTSLIDHEIWVVVGVFVNVICFCEQSS